MNKYKRTQEHVVYENARVEVFDDEVITPEGAPGRYFRFKYKGESGGVVVVPRTHDGRYLLIRVHRYAFDDESLEFPRGSILSGEIPRDAVSRELLEETGLHAREFLYLGVVRPDTSIAQMEAHIFLGDLPEDAERAFAPQRAEAISEATVVTFEELLKLVKTGAILDGYTLAAVAMMVVGSKLE